MPSSVYVRLPNWVGDACMCLPAIALLQDAGLPLVLCGRPWARDLFAGLAPAAMLAVGQGFRADLQHLRSRPIRGARGLLFTNSFSSALTMRLAHVPAVGYRGDGRSLLLRWPVARPAVTHEVEVFYHLARQALARWKVDTTTLPESPPPRLHLPLTAGNRGAATQALALAGIDRPVVLLSPTATGLHHGQPKAWPHFEALARALNDAGHCCVICPPPNEVAVAQAAVPSAKVLPSLPLGGFAALAQRAALVVCNDSGTSHLAAAVGARQITLFGVTRRERTGPWSPDAVCLGAHDAWPDIVTVVERALQMLDEAPRDAAETELRPV
jgi:heptosyltransferase-2